MRLGPVVESAFVLQHREAGQDTGGFLWFCVEQEETQQCNPPLTLGGDPRQLLFPLIFLVIYSWGNTTHGRLDALLFFFFSGLVSSVVERYPPSFFSPLGWNDGWVLGACMGDGGPGSFFRFPFLVSWMHGYGSNDGYTPHLIT